MISFTFEDSLILKDGGVIRFWLRHESEPLFTIRS